LEPGVIFVFGSNLQGIHGKGAARDAMNEYAAVWGQSEGIQGRSYALPTCSRPGKGLLLGEIRMHVDKFAMAVEMNPHLSFFVTAVGTGYAGHREEDIAPMFRGISRCWFPHSWLRYLEDR
jgi:predicted 3-demethylubiquinone-9 3-methyltransferase (glyoxalase superfamily)